VPPFAEKRAQKSHPPTPRFFQKETATLIFIIKTAAGLGVLIFGRKIPTAADAVFLYAAGQILKNESDFIVQFC